MEIVHVNKNNFEKEVLNSSKKVLVDFWAPWCGPCRMLGPVMDEIAKENDDIKVCKINVDDETELAQEYAVFSIPTVLVFEDGTIVNKSVGYRPKKEILNLIK